MPLSSPHNIRDGEEAHGSCCPLPSCRLGVAAVCLLHTSSWFSISLLGEMVLSHRLLNLKFFEQLEKKLYGLVQALEVGHVLLEVVAHCLGA